MKKEIHQTQEGLASIFIEELKSEGKLPAGMNVDKLKTFLGSEISGLEELQKFISP